MTIRGFSSVSAIAMLSVSLGGTAAYAEECLLAQDAPGGVIVGFTPWVTTLIGTLGADNNDSSGALSTACGVGADSTGIASSAYGYRANAAGNSSVAIGTSATTALGQSTAIGTQALASNAQSTAIGALAHATHFHSTALGANTVTTADNQIVLGVVAPTAFPTEQIVLNATNEILLNGGLAATINATTVTINDTSTTIASLAGGGVVVADASGTLGLDTTLVTNVNNNSTAIGVNAAGIALNSLAIAELREGNAAIAALPDLYLNNDETWTVAGGVSLYDDGFGGSETGFGGGVQFRGDTSDQWSIGLVGSVAGGTYSGRLQARFGG